MWVIWALSVLATSQVAPREYAIKPAEQAVIEQTIRDSLKDPQSAIFGPMRAKEDGSARVHVCGLVNAKNSFGAYIGDQVFYGFLSPWGKVPSFNLFDISQDARSAKILLDMCMEAEAT